MANITAYNQLLRLENHNNYARQFENIADRPLSIPRVGEFIQKDEFGNDKYTHCSTPNFNKTIFAVSSVGLATLGSATVIITASLVANQLILLGLIPTTMALVGGIGLALYYFNQIDLDSPKQRQEEMEKIRSHQLTLTEMNKRYGGFSKVVGYQLMGHAPLETYQRAANLSRMQAETDQIYHHHLSNIERVYARVVGPARSALNKAQHHEWMALSRALENDRQRNLVNRLDLYLSAHDRRCAENDFNQITRDVDIVYQQVKRQLEAPYRQKTEALEREFQSLPLN